MENGENNKDIKLKFKQILKKWWLWLIICIIIVCAAVAFGGNAKTEKVSNSKHETAKSKSSSSNSNLNTNANNLNNKIYKVGEAVQLKDYKITVNNVYVLSPTEMYAPKDGDEFLAINCTIENTSKEQQTISSIMMFKIVDKDGKECKYSITGQSAAQEKQLDCSLAAGDKITGIYVVEASKGKTGLQLEFDKILVDNNKTIIKLN